MFAAEIGSYAIPLAAAIVSAATFLMSGLTVRRQQETTRLVELEHEAAELRRLLADCDKLTRQLRDENTTLMRRILKLENGE